MSKVKAWFITGDMMSLFGMILWLLYRYDVGSFWTMVGMFGVYGFGSFFWDLGRWLLWRPENRLPSASRHAGSNATATWEQI